MYDKLLEAFLEDGYDEQTAQRLAESISDGGFSSVKSILNNLDDEG